MAREKCVFLVVAAVAGWEMGILDARVMRMMGWDSGQEDKV